jgi:HNH endonuclease
MKRQSVRSSVVIRDFKESRRAPQCESCRWRPPKGLLLIVDRPLVEFLHGHHVVPVACGGADEATNLALLCQRCHAIAHRLGSITGIGDIPRHWSGPETRAQLLFELQLIRDDRAWAEYIKGGRRYDLVLADESVRADVRAGAHKFELSVNSATSHVGGAR